MVDTKKVTTLADRVRGYVLKLKKFQTLTQEKFLEGSLHVDSARLNLQYAIEACLDLTNHLISRLGFRAPKDYADSFKVLAENGVVPESLLEDLRKMAKMRNRLVHLYWETDDKEIYNVIQNYLIDFETFIQSVLSYIAKPKES